MTTPLGLYGAALRAAALGRKSVLRLLDDDGVLVRRIDPHDWMARLRPGDASVLSRCAGPILDVGCGPGRLAAALIRSGRYALGIDVSAEAVRQAVGRGAQAIRGDVFGPLPGEGCWHSVLLVDGNIGIGGDPVGLLRRCAQLQAPGGAVLVEVAAPGDRSWTGYVRLQYAQRQSAPFPWASVCVDDIAAVASRTDMRVHDVWTEAGRWFARLAG